VAVVVSSANRCYYCLVAHGAAVRQLSGDAELGEMMALMLSLDLPVRIDPVGITNEKIDLIVTVIVGKFLRTLRNFYFRTRVCC
jgi:AhpD family alkylhydroperoxidase